MLSSTFLRVLAVIVCSSLFVICDTLAANWGKSGSVPSLIGTIVLAPFSYILFGYLNQKYAFAVISTWVVLALCVATVAIGYFYFGDQLSMRQVIGIGLAVISLSLLVF